MPRQENRRLHCRGNRLIDGHKAHRRHDNRQRGACSIRGRREGAERGRASVAIAAAGHADRGRCLRVVASVPRGCLSRHVGCTVDLTAFGEAQRQRQRRNAHQHGDSGDSRPRLQTRRE